MRTQAITCTQEQDQGVAWLAQECLNNGVRFDGLVQWATQAGDLQVAAFFRRAEREARRLSGRLRVADSRTPSHHRFGRCVIAC